MNEAKETATTRRSLHSQIPTLQWTQPRQEESRHLRSYTSHCPQWSPAARTLMLPVPAASKTAMKMVAVTMMAAERTPLQAPAVEGLQEHLPKSARVPSAVVLAAAAVLQADLCPNLRRCGESITTRDSVWRISVGTPYAADFAVGRDSSRLLTCCPGLALLADSHRQQCGFSPLDRVR